MQNKIAMMLALAAALGLAGCNGGDNGGSTDTPTAAGSTTKPAKGKTYNVAVIPKGNTHEFWKSVHAGADDAGKQFGATIKFQGPEKEDDRQSQVDMMENIVSAGSDAIVLAPLDAKGLRKSVDNALAKKIPVVIIDSALDGAGFSSFVATDNEKGGTMAADEMIKALGGKGKVVVLRYAPGSASTEAREKGFEDEIKAKGAGIQIVSDNQFAGATAESAQKKSEDLLAPLKGSDGKLTINGIFCPNESSTLGMLATLRGHSWAGSVKFVGFDSAPGEVDAMAKGDIDALVVQSPYNIGFQGVKAAVETLQGKKVEARIDTGATLVTKATMNTPEMQKLLKPKQAE